MDNFLLPSVMTPCYIFNIKELKNRVSTVIESFGSLPITYSMKANPFLIDFLPQQISHIEACSPGELEICIRKNISPCRIIYSGVVKEYVDVKRAVMYGVGIITIESFSQYKIIKQIAREFNRQISVIIRLTSGNQFGLDKYEIVKLIYKINQDDICKLKGFHYYSGTQKSKKGEFEKDINNITELLQIVKQKNNYTPTVIEYGPGLAVDYFISPYDDIDKETIKMASGIINKFASDVEERLVIELGRYIAAPCGRFETTVKDIKTNNGVTYVIVDGGIHQINYYRQIMAMNKPPLSQSKINEDEKYKYTICGSLCTVADVIVRDVDLKKLQVGDVLTFHRVGAYSMCEAPALFLSRKLPYIYIEEDDGLKLIRDSVSTSIFNSSM